MTTTPTPLKPLDQALADLDSEEAVSDRLRRAKARAEAMIGEERDFIFRLAGIEVQAALAPMYYQTRRLRTEFEMGTGQQPREDLGPEAGRMAGRNLDALVQRQVAAMLRHADEQALYDDPDRQEEQRVWQCFNTTVTGIARTFRGMGGEWDYPGLDGEAGFVAKVQHLVNEHAAAQDVGDSNRRVDAQLEKLGCPYPHLPAAAFTSARAFLAGDALTNELARLVAKYGPNADPEATPEAPAKSRRTRKVTP